MPYWTRQANLNYEIILVNDRSTDDSARFLNEIQLEHPHLKVIHLEADIPKRWMGKRDALWQGIQAASNDFVLLTDADCRPLSKHWVSMMASGFDDEKEIVIGASPYIPANKLINHVVQYETTLTALMYLSMAKIGRPYMGVGRNIAYKKLLLEKSVFEKSNQSLSGDDDLIFQQLATKTNVCALVHEDAYTVSEAPTTWRAWFDQKVRHFGSGRYYNKTALLQTGLFAIFNITVYLIAYLGLLIEGEFLYLLLPIVKAIMFKLICYRPANLLKAKIIQGSVFVSDFLYWHSVVLMYILPIFRATNGWKNKKIG